VCGDFAQNTEASTTVAAGTGPFSPGCGSRAGYTRSFLNMRYLLVLDAGHLVPMDQPRRALDLVNRFLNNRTFNNLLLPSMEEAIDTPSTQAYAEGGRNGASASAFSLVGAACFCAVAGVIGFAANRRRTSAGARVQASGSSRASWVRRNEDTPLLSMSINDVATISTPQSSL
jgi:hypothetical protein